MKLIHLSDLHIGKKLNGYSMLEDQKYILNQILDIVKTVSPDGIIIAGDIYDKSVPPSEAVTEFDDFLYALSEMDKPIFIISGNHDSAERLSFGSRIMSDKKIYISPVYNGNITPVECEDEYGSVFFYLLPFIKPNDVKKRFPDAPFNGSNYSDAVRFAVEQMNIDPSERNVIVTHQFVKGASKSDSEEPCSVGGTDEVAADIFDVFDYTALGHIHGPQNIGKPNIRYCGTPLKYSFSEEKHKKSVTVVDIREKGVTEVSTIDLNPLRDMRTVEGEFAEVRKISNYTEDYVRVILTNSEPVHDAFQFLRETYPNIMILKNGTNSSENTIEAFKDDQLEKRSPLDIVAEFLTVKGVEMTDMRKNYLEKIISEIWEGKNETD